MPTSAWTPNELIAIARTAIGALPDDDRRRLTADHVELVRLAAGRLLELANSGRGSPAQAALDEEHARELRELADALEAYST